MSASPTLPRWFNLILAGLLLGAYAFIARANDQVDGFWTNDQGSKFLQVQAWVSSRWQQGAITYPGKSLDPDGAFSPLRKRVFFRLGDQFLSIYLTPYLLLVSVLYAGIGSAGLYVVSVVS